MLIADDGMKRFRTAGFAVVFLGCRGQPAETRGGATAPDAMPDVAQAAVAAREVDPEMPRVPGGRFTMGADRGGEEDEHPAHTVTLSSFRLDRTEVTNAAYAECVAAKACRRPDPSVAAAMLAGPEEAFRRPMQPVVGVSWDDARAYCAFRGKRLPREAEFERAVRGDDGRRFPWGGEPPTREKVVFGRLLGNEATEDVASHSAGRGPYGHEDLAGNVWEWMEDEYDPIAYTRTTADEGKPGTCAEILAACATLRREGKQGFTGSNPIPQECEHALRGGAFNSDGASLRSTNRVHHPGRFRLVVTGFRCAKDD